ncbi:MAG: MFS transporter [candidate division Zixibacteria bacterium]|nr:MFS transporter [candidate division Zixibacteria bacterium]
MAKRQDGQGDRSAYGLRARIHRDLADYAASVRLFSRNARLYLLGSFLIGINFSVFQLLFNLYLKELGFVEGDIGVINSFRAVGMTAVAIPAAMLLSRMRLKPILLVSTVLFGVFSVVLTSVEHLEYLLGFAFLAGTAFSFYRVAGGPFYMRNSTRRERTHLFSFSFATHLFAGMAGSFGSGNLVTFLGDVTGDIVIGYRYTLWIGIGISLIALIPFALIKAAPPSAEENRISFSLDQLKRRGRFYVKITLANFLIGSGAGLIIPFLNLYYRDRFNLSPDMIGFYFILLSLGMLIGTLSGPFLTKRLGLVRTIVWTQLASMPFMLVLSYSYALALVVPAFVIRGALMNMGVPISTNFGMELSEKSEQGLVNALLMVSWTGSWMFSVALGGHCIESYGYTFTFNISIVLYILSSLVYWFFFRGVERRNVDGPGWHIPKDAHASRMY